MYRMRVYRTDDALTMRLVSRDIVYGKQWTGSLKIHWPTCNHRTAYYYYVLSCIG